MPATLPRNRQEMRDILLKAMALDPTGDTAAGYVMTCLDLAHNRGEMAAIERTRQFVKALDATPRWSKPQ